MSNSPAIMETEKRYGSFRYESEGQTYLLTRDSYPRLSLKVDLSRGLANITDLVPIDDCSAKEIADALAEVEGFIKILHKLPQAL